MNNDIKVGDFVIPSNDLIPFWKYAIVVKKSNKGIDLKFLCGSAGFLSSELSRIYPFGRHTGFEKL